MRDKVDHPRKGSKDLADAVCGSIYNAISRSKFDVFGEVEVHTYDSLKYEEREDVYVQNMIRAPRMPQQLEEALDRMEIL